MFIWFIISIILKYTLKNHKSPVKKTNAYRIFGIIPLREFLLVPIPSFLIWYSVCKLIKRNQKIGILIIESYCLLYITGIIMHSIFNVKSKLGHVLKITDKPDGTGLAPYSNY